mgnify:CR=1 FL=1
MDNALIQDKNDVETINSESESPALCFESQNDQRCSEVFFNADGNGALETLALLDYCEVQWRIQGAGV